MLFTAAHAAVVDPVRMMRKRVDTVASLVLDVDRPETTVLDVVDQLVNRGVVADGDLILGLAGVDLIYVGLSALLCAADRVLPRDRVAPRRHRERPRRRALKARS
jgi:hypothetical protein